MNQNYRLPMLHLKFLVQRMRIRIDNITHIAQGWVSKPVATRSLVGVHELAYTAFAHVQKLLRMHRSVTVGWRSHLPPLLPVHLNWGKPVATHHCV